MAEGIYAPSGVQKVYARNMFGRKLLSTLSLVGSSCNADPEGEFSAKVYVNGTEVVVSGVEGKQIEITSYSLVASGASIVTIRSSGTDIFGPVSLAANGQTNNTSMSLKGNEAEPIVLVTTSQVGGFITYRLV